VKLQWDNYLLGKQGAISTGEDLIQIMSQIEGEQVDVYWLDGNKGEVLKALVYIGNRYICELLPQPVYKRSRIEQTEQDLEARTLMSKYVSTIEGFGKRRRKGIEGITIVKEEETSMDINKKFNIKDIPSCVSITSKEPRERNVEILPELVSEEEKQRELIGVETGFKNSLFERF
jgi:hypothetical protein